MRAPLTPASDPSGSGHAVRRWSDAVMPAFATRPAGVPDATTRPRSRRTTRSQSRSASSIWWVL